MTLVEKVEKKRNIFFSFSNFFLVDAHARSHGPAARPPSFTVQPYVPVNVARAAAAAALYFMLGPMSSVTPGCSNDKPAHAMRSAS